ncbi:MAG TPA: winged helix DNA-binding domain-containing protein, partial [Jiangellaceae bacterium]
ASRLCGVHAQVMSGAAQIVGVRTSSFTTPDLDDTLWKQRTLIKTWGMRGTLHLFPAAELPLWVAAFKQRQWPRFTPAWEKYYGVKPDDMRRITAAVGEVLPGRVLTREELATEIAAALRKPALAEKIRSGWGVMLKPAAAGGLLCFGPDRDRNVTFTDPRSYVAGVRWHEVDPDIALQQIVTRFLDIYGPATYADFGRWWGTDAASARRIFTTQANAMVAVSVAGAKAWLTPPGAGKIRRLRAPHGVLLLPGFDPYTIAPISARAYTIPTGFVDRVSRTAGWISPVLLVDGVVAGTWSTARRDNSVTIEIEPFAKVSGATKQAAATFAQRYARILDADVDVSWVG